MLKVYVFSMFGALAVQEYVASYCHLSITILRSVKN